ncbi:hypothetical protein ZWY2020_009385 [Hordeum vulgare]|nr:hypothetical protein ZWY2020_009385 [Hordeum vulgare]
MPVSLFDLFQNWIPAYTGKDRVVVSVACFQNTLLRDPTDVVFNVCSLLDSWSVLQKKKRMLNMLKEVTKRLAKVTCGVYSKSHGWGPAVRRIE